MTPANPPAISTERRTHLFDLLHRKGMVAVDGVRERARSRP
jgi:hypothetical protein